MAINFFLLIWQVDEECLRRKVTCWVLFSKKQKMFTNLTLPSVNWREANDSRAANCCFNRWTTNALIEKVTFFRQSRTKQVHREIHRERARPEHTPAVYILMEERTRIGFKFRENSVERESATESERKSETFENLKWPCDGKVKNGFYNNISSKQVCNRRTIYPGR